jgi:hypothetical protein
MCRLAHALVLPEGRLCGPMIDGKHSCENRIKCLHNRLSLKTLGPSPLPKKKTAPAFAGA